MATEIKPHAGAGRAKPHALWQLARYGFCFRTAVQVAAAVLAVLTVLAP